MYSQTSFLNHKISKINIFWWCTHPTACLTGHQLRRRWVHYDMETKSILRTWNKTIFKQLRMDVTLLMDALCSKLFSLRMYPSHLEMAQDFKTKAERSLVSSFHNHTNQDIFGGTFCMLQTTCSRRLYLFLKCMHLHCE